MTTSSSLALRVSQLEHDQQTVHQAILEQVTRLEVLEATTEKGFAALEKRFDRLLAWLEERL